MKGTRYDVLGSLHSAPLLMKRSHDSMFVAADCNLLKKLELALPREVCAEILFQGFSSGEYKGRTMWALGQCQNRFWNECFNLARDYFRTRVIDPMVAAHLSALEKWAPWCFTMN